MKYTSEQLRQLTLKEWTEAMAEELNKAGFLARGFNQNTGRFEKNQEPYKIYDEATPSSFILGAVDSAPEIEHLKSVGLLNNGRCPMCGKPFLEMPGRFTSGFDSNIHFQICQNCVKNKGRNNSEQPTKGSNLFLSIIGGFFGLIGTVLLFTIKIIIFPIRLVFTIIVKLLASLFGY